MPRSRIASTDEHFVLTLWTDDPALARAADSAGVDRIGVDLERLGKRQRQRGLGTWVSPHTEQDLAALQPEVRRADLFVRVNPWHDGTPREVEDVLAVGARVLMLPMAADAATVERFVELVDGRALVVLLVETANGLARLGELLAVGGIGEVHVGLNDLALSLDLPNRWLALGGDLVAAASEAVRARGLRFGFGGIGRAGDSSLPVPADLVYAEYARLGATSALVSRSFFGAGVGHAGLGREIARARNGLAAWARRGTAAVDAAHLELMRRSHALATW